MTQETLLVWTPVFSPNVPLAIRLVQQVRFLEVEKSNAANNNQTCAKYDPATTKLFVCDTVNNRVMIFDGTALPAADYYLP
jgi:hypothetical protein